MQPTPVVFDAERVLAGQVTLTPSATRIAGEAITSSRGWLRRLAPAGWAETLEQPGVSAAERAAAVSALAAIARDDQIHWLTPIDRLGGSENKPFQYRRAARAGVPVPDWVVTTAPQDVPSAGSWVAKPLGPGAFMMSTDEAG